MANMSYCRFQNTLSDLKACAGYLDGDEDREMDGPTPVERLSDDERRAFRQLVQLCGEIEQHFGEEARRG